MIRPGIAPAAPVRGVAAAALLTLAACSHVLTRAGPVTRPGGDAGTVVYVVGALSFPAPADWRADGDDLRLRLDGPEATLEATASPRQGASPDCLADAEAALSRGAAGLTGVRRHATTFAGQRAVTQEADQADWHGWAWATCAGGVQYRIWLAARSPVAPATLEAQRILVEGARLGAGAAGGGKP